MRVTALILSAYICLGAMFPRLDYGQLVRIYNLSEHFEQHRQEVGEAQAPSIWAFLNMHLLEDIQHEHPDSRDHQQLPFQYLSGISSLIVSEIPTIPHDIREVHSSQVFFYRAGKGFLFKSSILQPPIA